METLLKKLPPCVLILFLIGWFGVHFDGTSSPKGADATLTEYSAHRALAQLEVIAKGPRPMGSPAHQAVQQFLVEALNGFGLEVQLHKGDAAQFISNPFPNLPPVNILARLKGTTSKSTILLSAHYDSVQGAPGAGDNGAGVATVLETLRAIKQGPALENDLIIAFVDGEEEGLLGSKLFTQMHPWAADVDLILNLDARGVQGPTIMYETTSQDDWLMSEYHKGVPSAVAYSVAVEIYKMMPNSTDFSEYRHIDGVQGLNFAFLGGPNYYHTGADTLTNLNPSTLQHQGDQILEAVRHFGNLEIQKGQASAGIYFYLPGFGQVHYPMAMVWPFIAVILLLLAAVLVRDLRSGKIRLLGYIGGVLTSLLFLLVGMLGCALLWQLAQFAPVRLGPAGHPYRSEDYFYAYLFVCGGLLLSLKNLVCRKLQPEHLILGSLTLWVILAVIMSLAAVGGSYLFVLPSLFALVGMLLTGKASADKRRGSWISALSLVPTLLIYLPLISLLHISLPYASIPIPALLTGLTSGLLMLLLFGPLHWTYAEEDQGFLPKGVLVIGLLFMGGLTWLNHSRDIHHPAPESFFYLSDRDAGQHYWVSQDDAPTQWNQAFFEKDIRHETLPMIFRTYPNKFMMAPAPDIETSGTQVEVALQAVEGSWRDLTLTLTPPADALILRVFFEDAFKEGRLGESEIASDLDNLHLNHRPNETYQLRFKARADQPYRLRVVTILPGLPRNQVEVPKDVMPSPRGVNYLEHNTVISETITLPVP